jgi:RimJ/RimL family protein N-acetyltransferase
MILSVVNCTIRPYTITDRSLLITTINAVCAEGRWMRTRCYEPTPAWEHALAEPNCSCHLLLIAVDEERVVGWCRVFRDANAQTNADVAIGLLPDYRGHGLGTELFKRTMAWTCENELGYLYLTTRVDNMRAIYFFKKFGFTVVRALDENWLEMATCPLIGEIT